MRFTKPKKVVGLDIGTHAVKAVQMSRSGNKLHIEDVGYAVVDHNQIEVDPVAAQASALREAIRKLAISSSSVIGALPGQTVVIRYPRLRDLDVNQIDQAIESEASQNIPYDLSEVFLDWSLLDEEVEGDERHLKVLLAAAKNEVIESRVHIADAADIAYSSLSVDSLALADAAEGCNLLRPDETAALINIGLTSVSIHFTKDGVSNFIRDVNWGAKELIQSISKVRHCDFEQAQEVLFHLEEALSGGTPVAAEPEAAAPPPPPAPPQGEVPEAPGIEEPAAFDEAPGVDEAPAFDDVLTIEEPGFGEVDGLEATSVLDEPLGVEEPSMLEDPPAFDPNEGGSALEPLDDEFDTTLDEPASAPQDALSPLDPVDEPADAAPAGGGGDDVELLREALSVPIARLVSEVRRSFDYYEHQLYERPVERVILSGGAAHLSLIREALIEDMGVDEVSVADPRGKSVKIRKKTGVPEFDEHPAQFMVAIGLAARGVSEL